MSILLDVGIGLEINVYQMLGEMGCHPEICFYMYVTNRPMDRQCRVSTERAL